MASTITSAITVEFKKKALNGDFGTSDVYQCALIKGTAGVGTYNKNTRYYTDLTGNSDEITGTGYTAKGVTITKTAGPSTTNTTETVGYLDFTDAQWTTATFSDVRGCVVFNDTDASDTALFWLDFGGTYQVTSGTFTIQWPAAAEGTAMLRFS